MRVVVIGQGYVGLTVAISAANSGHIVFGLDINKYLIDELLIGKTQIPGIDKEQLVSLVHQARYVPTLNEEVLKDAEIVVIAVPTPLDVNREPDLSALKAAAELISKNVTNETLIVNESTSYPGTLRNYIKPLIEENTSLRLNYASAPERVDPGNKDWKLNNTPRVISGITDVATEMAINFYSSFCSKIYRASSPEVAEASKIFENTFRQINIALSNEFSEIANVIGFSATEAILAASTKPFGFMPFYPSIGVGGHCIPVDPTYLSYIAGEFGIKAKFIELANETNINMARKVAARIQSFLNGDIDGASIQIAGISYKPGVSDMRESPALRLIDELKLLGAQVTWHDPLVEVFEDQKSLPLNPSIDLGLIVSPHREIDFSTWVTAGTKVLDLSPNTINTGWPKFL